MSSHGGDFVSAHCRHSEQRTLGPLRPTARTLGMLREAKVEQAGVSVVAHARNAPLTQHPWPIRRKLWQQPTLGRVWPVDVAGTAARLLDQHLRRLTRRRIDRADVHDVARVLPVKSMPSSHPVHRPCECSRIRAAATDECPKRMEESSAVSAFCSTPAPSESRRRRVAANLARVLVVLKADDHRQGRQIDQDRVRGSATPPRHDPCGRRCRLFRASSRRRADRCSGRWPPGRLGWASPKPYRHGR